MIVALCGGVGAARFLAGLVTAREPTSITAVVNTGDDFVLHGLHISPDLDTVTYTLAGAVNPETGWGLAGETWTAMESLARYGGATWFRLGDRDLGTHLYRSQRLAEGASLSEITDEVTTAWGLAVRVIPMTNDRVETRVTLREGGEVGFQEYFVGHRHDVPVAAVRFDGSDAASPAPGVLAAIRAARRVIVCPSNPILSIAPILAVPGIADALADRREDVVAISPLVGGKALKGPADRVMAELGHDPSVAGVARIYAPIARTLIIDESDRDRAADVAALDMRPVVTETVMASVDVAARLAEAALTGP